MAKKLHFRKNVIIKLGYDLISRVYHTNNLSILLMIDNIREVLPGIPDRDTVFDPILSLRNPFMRFPSKISGNITILSVVLKKIISITFFRFSNKQSLCFNSI